MRPVRPRTLVVLVTLASGVAQAFGRFSYAVLLPSIDRDLLGSYALAGLIGTVNVGAYLLGTLAVSTLARRAAPADLIRAGLAASCAGLAVMSQAGSALTFTIGTGLAGVGGAFIWVPAPGLAGSVVRTSRRGAAIGLAGTGIGVGIVFVTALAAVLQSRGGDGSWRTVYLVEAVLALVVLGLCLLLLRPAAHPADMLAPRSAALRQVPGWLGIVGGYAAYGLAYSIYTSYLVTALEDDAGLTPGRAALVYALIGVSFIGGGVLLGPLSDRWGRGRTLVAGHLVMATAILLVPLGLGPLAVVSAIAFGLMMSGLPTVIAAHLADVLTPREFAGAFGRCTLFFGVAQLCGPPLGGLLAERTGAFATSFAVAGCAALLGAAASVAVVRAPAVRTG